MKNPGARPATLSEHLKLRHSAFSGPQEEACLALVRTGESLGKRADRLLAPHGLTAPQFNVLMVLRYEGKKGLSQVALGQRLLLSRPNVSLHVKRLEGRGLVHKADAPGSAREHRITLTAAARRLLAAAVPAYNAEVVKAMVGLSARDCRALNILLARLWSSWG